MLTSNAIWFFNFTTWGIWLLLVGAVELITGWGVLRAMTWARVVGIAIASLNLISMLPILNVAPFYSLLIISIDIIVIWALAARGGEFEMVAA